MRKIALAAALVLLTAASARGADGDINLFISPAGEPFTGEIFGAPVHRVTDLDPQTATPHHSRLAREKLAIQPRRTWRIDLLLKSEV